MDSPHLPLDPDLPESLDDTTAARDVERLDPRAVAAVVLGGCIGGPLRYAAGQMWPHDDLSSFPWSTFAVNLLGSFLLAVVVVLVVEGRSTVRYLREFAGVGVLGSFTTFSSWMVETQERIDDGEVALALVYVGGSLLLGIVAALLGLVVGRTVVRAGGRR